MSKKTISSSFSSSPEGIILNPKCTNPKKHDIIGSIIGSGACGSVHKIINQPDWVAKVAPLPP
eukprot:CAMPEP_0194383272 /NCGR_PEP_ID=MMETSP0174-20130528/66411_1 /TAXON_ID=216777 /ORGANISM="Proboscia alata, Strain PI-D3" /LENGTH=62 /DNA_ID=CAMNT_0039169361 /DNA_START=9 /DNA_END=193 /DNA_ORIENTATION=-